MELICKLNRINTINKKIAIDIEVYWWHFFLIFKIKLEIVTDV